MPPDIYNLARDLFFRQCFVEGAGIFWLAAELAILLFVLAARRHLEASPASSRLVFTRADAQCAFGFAIGTIFLSAIVYGRHFVVPPAYLAPLPDPSALARALEGQVYRHLLFWAGFVTGWVALEAVIVYHGYRAWRALMRLLQPQPHIPRGSSSVACIAAPIAVLFLQYAGPWRSAYDEVMATTLPAYNALYLYLRLAGLVWIALEAAAALLLVLAFRAVRYKVREMSHA